jgi:hypothetical protein
MKLSEFLIRKLSILKEEADLLVKHIRKFYNLKKFREFYGDKDSISIYLSMDNVISDTITAESDCLRKNIDSIYPKIGLAPLQKYRMVVDLLSDIRTGDHKSVFSQSSINEYVENKKNNIKSENKSSVEKIMDNFYKFFIRDGYINNLKVLDSFKTLNKGLIELSKIYPNIKIGVINYLHSNQSVIEIRQRIDWLNSNTNYSENIRFIKDSKSLSADPYSILIDSDITDCLLFEDKGGHTILYDSDKPEECIKQLKTIIEEHF